MERRRFPWLQPDSHPQHRRACVQRRDPEQLLRDAGVHAVPERTHDGAAPGTHRY